jgi:hypothetical protein
MTAVAGEIEDTVPINAPRMLGAIKLAKSL